MVRRARGIGLLSGGLDSALACLLLRDAGADVECLHFFTGFCVTGHNSRVGRKDRPIANHALKVAAEMNIPVELIDASEDYLPVVLKPKFGYGKNMNPCVDCRVFMLQHAKVHMERTGADFVFTGEVMGQRPKSQLKKTLATIETEVGLEGRLLRPLSAKLLPPTDVETKGLVDREKLMDISGRSRKAQLALAKRYNISEFMTPAGGCCFLTDESYSKKFKDVLEHGGAEDLSPEDIFVLGVGRHFRLSPHAKVVVGRDEMENNFLHFYKKDHWCAEVEGFSGPTAVVLGAITPEEMQRAAALVARYSDAKNEPAVSVRFEFGDNKTMINAAPAAAEVVDKYRV